MTPQPPDYYEPPDPAGPERLPCAPEAERDLVGAVLFDEVAFERANLKSSDFFIHRWRWFWEACEAIKALNDHIDEGTLEKQLVKAGHWEDVTGGRPLNQLLKTTLLHVEADARLVKEMVERRRMLAGATQLARRAWDMNSPLPAMPGAVKSHWTLEEMAAAEFPAPDGPVPGMIPNGLTVLGGRPKRGKSWLMLQLGCTLGIGGKFLDHDLKLGKVLYYALEDPPRRIKDRAAKLGIPTYSLIEFELALQPLQLGGMAAVAQAAEFGGYRMIIIDTIRRAMPGKDFNKDGALFDDILGQLQKLAHKNKIAIVVVLHTRKSNGGFDPDPVDDMLGSTGLTAAADCVLALYTEQGRKGATLKGRCRELDNIDLALSFDPVTCAWQSLGESGEAINKERELEILAALEDLGKVPAHTIAKTLGKDYSNTHKVLSSLWTAGKIRKDQIEGKTYYFLPKVEKQ